MRDTVKRVVGSVVAATVPHCRYDRCIFIVAHMRCGSTALSNILCSRSDTSGYGEAHIRYDGQGALGRLVVNQALRRSWSPGAQHLFDKILHSRHDAAAVPAFFTARAIFVARRPAPAIASIRKLFDGIGRGEYASDAEAAEYYIERVTQMMVQWHRFPAGRRVGLTHTELVADPDSALARISHALNLRPPLENRYTPQKASQRGGAGDPTASASHTRIEPRPDRPDKDDAIRLDIPDDMRRAAEDAYAAYTALIGA